MNHLLTENIGILAIDPTTRGFGFAVMEGADYLIDWGVKEGRDNDKDTHCLNNILELIDRYMPMSLWRKIIMVWDLGDVRE